jgi:hypothetical protein
MVIAPIGGEGPGRFASARLALFLMAAAAAAQPAAAQQPRPVQQPRTGQQVQQPARTPAAPAATQIPDQLTALKLVWATMAAVDQANRTGNYSVLRDLGSAAFQAGSNPATLATAFAPLRNQGIDLTDTLLVMPVWTAVPAMAAGQLRMSGNFPIRTASVVFDLAFVWDRGWRIHGIAVRSGNTPR